MLVSAVQVLRGDRIVACPDEGYEAPVGGVTVTHRQVSTDGKTVCLVIKGDPQVAKLELSYDATVAVAKFV